MFTMRHYIVIRGGSLCTTKNIYISSSIGSCDPFIVSHDLLCRINDVQNFMVAMEILVNYLDPSCKDVDEAANGEVTIVTVYITWLY